MYNYSGERTDTGLCEPLWSIRRNSQLKTKLETKDKLQAQVYDYIKLDADGCVLWVFCRTHVSDFVMSCLFRMRLVWSAFE